MVADMEEDTDTEAAMGDGVVAATVVVGGKT